MTVSTGMFGTDGATSASAPSKASKPNISLPPVCSLDAVPTGRYVHAVIKEMEEKMVNKISTVLWFEKGGEAAARLYTSLIPNSRITTKITPPMDGQPQPAEEALVIDFELYGVPYQILNGGPHFKQSEAVSIMVQTEDQAETDRLWNALIADGGAESQCGWLKDKWGVSWQITPSILLRAISSDDRAAAKRAMDAMMKMRKIDIAAIEAAVRG
jgi:predicted 3-demethylubiquinone-9 3-methyltransferase (glyoxalase superfamily)